MLTNLLRMDSYRVLQILSTIDLPSRRRQKYEIAILHALTMGQTDPESLATFADPRLRASRDDLVAAVRLIQGALPPVPGPSAIREGDTTLVVPVRIFHVSASGIHR